MSLSGSVSRGNNESGPVGSESIDFGDICVSSMILTLVPEG